MNHILEYVVKSEAYRARLVLTGARIDDSSIDSYLILEKYVGTREVGFWTAIDSASVTVNAQEYSRREIESCITRITQLELENRVLKGMLENK